MEQQQKKRDGPVRCVCEERRASEERRARGSVWVGTSSLRYVGVAVVRTLSLVMDERTNGSTDERRGREHHA